MKAFEDQFNIPGRTKLEVVNVQPATPIPKIIENIKANKERRLLNISDNTNWRGVKPIAIVGGGPSLKSQLEKLDTYDCIIACGSVHDYLVSNDITPTWCAICDPDPIVNKYLTNINRNTIYFVASQCDSSTFDLLANRVPHYIWHLAGDKFDNSIYGDGAVAVGGGCTIGTRAMVIAMNMGFFNLHLFGMDTCLGKKGEHHAYEFVDPEVEKQSVSDEYDIQFEIDGPTFKVAGYHLAQLMDIKTIMAQYANILQITVYGDSLLSYFMDLAKKRLQMKKEYEAKYKDQMKE